MTTTIITPERKRELLERIREAAAKALLEEDPWAKYDIPAIPAERIVRYLYNPELQQWSTYETIAKMEPAPFTHGAMRYCYRMKKLAAPPKDASNTRFHSYGWSRAPNYVAKCYTNDDGSIDTSYETRQAVKNDIMLQYEAAHWAEKFNARDPPKKINFIRAYGIEFPDRDGSPVFAVERFISGRCQDGEGFVKHNTNSGFVDQDLGRATPQVFSAHSFYASRGHRLVADIQGVGDLFTDPQVHSMDYRFGEGDLGPRGMALFFTTFHHCELAASLGIPEFPLSRNERRYQMETLGVDEDEEEAADDESLGEELERALDRFAKLDLNRQKRQTLLLNVSTKPAHRPSRADTETRSNMSKSMLSASSSSSRSLSPTPRSPISRSRKQKPRWKRSQSEADEDTTCLSLALDDFVYDHRAFHRLPSGELDRSQHGYAQNGGSSSNGRRRKTIMAKVLHPIMPDDETRANLGLVHYHLACLHGSGRFPEVVPPSPMTATDEETTSRPPHDVHSVLFHLCHASSLGDARSCLALARLRSGLTTTVSDLLPTVVSVDFALSQELAERAMNVDESSGSASTRAAAGCLLIQTLENEGGGEVATTTKSVAVMLDLVERTLEMKVAAEEEKEQAAAATAAQSASDGGGVDSNNDGVKVGEKVEGNFAMEGTYYPGTVVEVLNDGSSVIVQYDDDGSSEELTLDNVKRLTVSSSTLPKTATNAECFMLDSVEDEDERCLLETYELLEKLGQWKEYSGDDLAAASRHYEEAAEGAMEQGMMKKATELSLKAASLSA